MASFKFENDNNTIIRRQYFFVYCTKFNLVFYFIKTTINDLFQIFCNNFHKILSHKNLPRQI